MYKLLIGPALVGTGYAVGSVYSADAEQLVHKSPRVTYAGIEQALDNLPSSGKTFFEGGNPVPYEIKIDRIADQQLKVSLYFAGQEGAQAELDFIPRNDGKDTLVVTKIHSNHSVLRTALAGTDKAKLAYAPDWMLNMSVRPVLQQLAAEVEKGAAADFGMSEADSGPEPQPYAANEQPDLVSEAQQEEATRPLVDPDADAKRHMNEDPGR